MISALKNLLKQHLGEPGAGLTQAEAATALLIEVVLADEQLSKEELSLLPKLIADITGEPLARAQGLLDDAINRQHQATSLFEYTDLINREFDLPAKQALVLAMWQLAFADGSLCQYEEQIIRKTADLLYLRHSELIRLRNQATVDPAG